MQQEAEVIGRREISPSSPINPSRLNGHFPIVQRFEKNLYTLEANLAVASDPIQRIDMANELAWELRTYNLPKAHGLLQQALHEAQALNYPEGIAFGERNMGFRAFMLGNLQEALVHLRTAMEIFTRLRDREQEASVMYVYGYVYATLGDYEEAINYAGKAYTIYETGSNRRGEAWADYALGMANFEMHSYDEALKRFVRAQEIFITVQDIIGEARTLLSISKVYRVRKSYGRALEYCMRAMALFEALQHKEGEAEVLLELGKIYQELDSLEDALVHFHDSLKRFEAGGHKIGIAKVHVNLGNLFFRQGKIDDAFVMLQRAYDTAEQMGAKPLIAIVNKHLAEVYGRMGNYSEAWKHNSFYTNLYHEVFTDEARDKLLNQHINFVLEKSKAEAEIFRIKNSDLMKANAELERVLEFTNDSIAYARRIQEAMLPKPEHIKALLPKSFVYFKPRDVVSGDFYWIAEWNDFIILAAVDCTGHGVPGAFMSVLGQSLLNQIVKEKYNFSPPNILQNLDLRLRDALRQDKASEVYDGMEAAIITINLEDKTLQYAGANIPLYLVNAQGLTMIPANPLSLGGASNEKVKEFSNNLVQIKTGDTIYLFSDGFRDQFGVQDADSKQKYSTRRFRKLLEQIYHEDMPRQQELLAAEFDLWKGKLKQLDDVMVIGVRF